MPVRRVAELGVLMVKALRRAHAAGIVHRDLKPDNVLLMDDRVIITDFGIAHVADATMTLTRTGTLLGTPAYMAPEQLEGGPPTPATDLWSLGATLYCALEGRPPFVAETFSALCVAIVMQDPPVPGRAGPLAPVLAALLTKDPAGRATAEQAPAALEAVAGGAAQRSRNRNRSPHRSPNRSSGAGSGSRGRRCAARAASHWSGWAPCCRGTTSANGTDSSGSCWSARRPRWWPWRTRACGPGGRPDRGGRCSPG
ncbi:hypothetical protein GCM10020254_10910 [Streptomyces goshikiensis]